MRWAIPLAFSLCPVQLPHQRFAFLRTKDSIPAHLPSVKLFRPTGRAAAPRARPCHRERSEESGLLDKRRPGADNRNGQVHAWTHRRQSYLSGQAEEEADPIMSFGS